MIAMASRAGVRMHGTTSLGAPRWAVRAALAVTLIPLPSSVWRIAGMLGAPLAEQDGHLAAGHGPVLATGPGYIIGLSVLSELLAFLTVGLVSDWGEVAPRWLPGIGGRRIPVLAAAIPAALGALVLTVVTQLFLIMSVQGKMIDGAHADGLHLAGWQQPVFIVAYAPLLAWGPLLALVTFAYIRRRTRNDGRN